jgi:hypothetical protein
MIENNKPANLSENDSELEFSDLKQAHQEIASLRKEKENLEKELVASREEFIKYILGVSDGSIKVKSKKEMLAHGEKIGEEGRKEWEAFLNKSRHP